MPEPTAWSYVDDRRTHRVDTTVHRGRTLEFVIEERALETDHPADVHVERHALVDAWEARVHQVALEHRLALLGNYYRTAGAGWTPIRPATTRTLDLTPLHLDEGDDASISFHHYQAKDSHHAVTLVSVREELQRGRRSLLARLDYSYPEVHGGNLQVVHPCLAPPLHRSLLASQHLELMEMGFEKLADHGMDARAWTALQAVLETILFRLLDGRLGKGGDGPVDAGGRPDLTTALEAIAIARKTRNAASVVTRTFAVDDELGPGNASPVETKKPSALMEDLPQDVVKAMNDPRLVALHARYLPPGRDAQLIEEGDLAILRTMRDKREQVPPHEQHLVSLVEASLLLRRALIKRTRVDPEVITRVRHAGVYL